MKGFLNKKMPTINSINSIAISRSVYTPLKAEPKKETEREQHQEAYSSTYSLAARSMAMAGISFVQTPEKTNAVNYIDGINATVVQETSGNAANQWWKEEMDYENPPYLPDSKVQHIKLEEDTKFVRVYDGVHSGMHGGWVMKAQDIEGLSAEQIQDKFALPQKPVKMCDVTLPKGTELRTGLCNPLKMWKNEGSVRSNGITTMNFTYENWGDGGGVQFDMMGKRLGEFANERPIENQ